MSKNGCNVENFEKLTLESCFPPKTTIYDITKSIDAFFYYLKKSAIFSKNAQLWLKFWDFCKTDPKIVFSTQKK